MIKVTLITNGNRTSFVVPETATPRQIFDQHEVNYAVGNPAIDSVSMKIGDMDKSLEALGVKEKCYLTCVVKADNAANVQIAGNACVITSAVKREDLELISKYRPDELKLFDGEGKEKEEKFSVMVTDENAGSLNRYGALFGPTTSAEGYATITLLIDPDETDVKQMVQDKIGAALLMLDQVEAHVPEVIDAIKADQALIEQHITVL